MNEVFFHPIWGAIEIQPSVGYRLSNSIPFDKLPNVIEEIWSKPNKIDSIDSNT